MISRPLHRPTADRAPLAWYLQGDYLYTVLTVAFNESIKSGTRISSLYNFVSVVTGIALGLVVLRVRRLKAFIVAGTLLFLVAFGLLIRYRGAAAGLGAQHSGVVGAQVLLGLAGGLFAYPAQASVQAAARHEHTAVLTGLYLACYSIGAALGNAVSGAIWSNVLPAQLASRLAAVVPSSSNASTLATSAYGSPFAFVAQFAMHTPERRAVVAAYQHTQRLLCITGICLCLPLIAFALALRDPTLGDAQSLPDAEGVPAARADAGTD